MKKTLGLALGSGGARGVAHVGFLQALDEAGIRPDYIAGCSMGAVIGACYAKGMSAAEIKEIVLKIKARDLIDLTPALISKMAILRSKKVRDLFVEYLGGIRIEEMKIPFKCVATDLYSGKLHVFDHGDASIAVQASSTIPGVFRPIEYEGKMFVDGGCLCRVPVRVVKEMGADVVVAVDVLKNAAKPVDKVTNILSMVLRVFDIMDTHITSLTREIEDGLCDLLLEPEMVGLSQYEIKDLDKAYDEGYEAGKDNIDRIRELLGVTARSRSRKNK